MHLLIHPLQLFFAWVPVVMVCLPWEVLMVSIKSRGLVLDVQVLMISIDK